MKILITSLLVLSLSGCAAVQKVTDLWPREHDPALVSVYINLEKAVEEAKCNDKASISNSVVLADWLYRYSEFRNDPQQEAVKAIRENLVKAVGSSEAVCNRWLNQVNIKMKIVKNSWSKR